MNGHGLGAENEAGRTTETNGERARMPGLRLNRVAQKVKQFTITI